MTKRAILGTVSLFTLLLAIVFCGHYASKNPFRGGKSKLPVGQINPAMALGEDHGIILASDGSLWSWGEEDSGWPVLGLGKTRPQACLWRIGHETNWVSIAASYSHNLAVKSDGSLWAWGGNFCYQLGDGTTQSRNTPIHSVPGNDWKQVAVGIHSVALKKDGTLWAWGNNWAGNLGNGSTNDSLIPVQVGSATNWVKVWACGIQNIGMQSDGSLWFWGHDMSVSPHKSILTPTRVSPDTNWVDVCFGAFMTLAIKKGGTLWAWGWKADIYTGSRDKSLNAMPVQVGTNADWRACGLSGNDRYQTFLKKDGSLWAMDSADPDDVPASSYKPPQFKRIALRQDFVAVGAQKGRDDPFGAALTRDGEVWTWGKALGQSTPTNRVLQAISRTISRSGFKFAWDPKPISQPWQLQNLDHDDAAAK